MPINPESVLWDDEIQWEDEGGGERAAPSLSPAEEAAFQKWYKGWAAKAGINPDPDDPLHKYDYRAAYRAGAQPAIDPGDGKYHWPSEFKADDHPNRFVDGIDTKTGRPALSVADIEWDDSGTALGAAKRSARKAIPSYKAAAGRTIQAISNWFEGSALDRFGRRMASGEGPVIGDWQDTATEAGQMAQKAEAAVEAINAEKPPELQGRVWEQPSLMLDPRWWIEGTGDAAISMAPTLAAHLAGGGLVSGAVGGSMEGTQLYKDLQKAGVEESTARNAALAFGTVSGVLNAVGAGKVLSKVAGKNFRARLVRRLVAGAWEGGTEYAEEPFEAAFAGWAKGEPVNEIAGDVVESLKNLDVIPPSVLLGAGGSMAAKTAKADAGRPGIVAEFRPEDTPALYARQDDTMEGVGEELHGVRLIQEGAGRYGVLFVNRNTKESVEVHDLTKEEAERQFSKYHDVFTLEAAEEQAAILENIPELSPGSKGRLDALKAEIGRLSARLLEEGIGQPISAQNPPAIGGVLTPDAASRGEQVVAFQPTPGFRRATPQAGGVAAEQPISRSSMVRFLREHLDVPIRTGRVNVHGALGIFKAKAEVIRSKDANDIETISHEVGHALHKFLGGGSKLKTEVFQPFAGELTKLASPGDPIAEGFAEFTRLYVTNEAEARKNAPQFYANFEALLSEKTPESLEILRQVREDWQRWLTQPALARVMAHISTDAAPKERFSFDDLQVKWTDDIHMLRKTAQRMGLTEETPMSERFDMKAQLSRGWWGKPDTFLEHGTFEYSALQGKPEDFEFNGKPLKKILEPFKGQLDQFRAYLVAARTVELAKRQIKTGISVSDAMQVIKDSPDSFEKGRQELRKYQQSILLYLAASGVVSNAKVSAITDANLLYVPFYRMIDPKDRAPGGAKHAGRAFQAHDPVKAIRGSTEDIIDPLESIVKNTYLFLNLAERNGVARALVDAAASHEGMGKFVERIPTPMHGIKVSGEELGKMKGLLVQENPEMEDQIKEVFDLLGDETMTIFRPNSFVPDADVIAVWKDGKRQLYQVDPDIADAIKGLNRESVNQVFKLMSYPARWLRAGATLTPEFIARNPARDQLTAFIYSQTGYLPGYDLARGVAHVIQRDDIYWKWKAAGGEHAALVSMDRASLQKRLDDLMASPAAKTLNILKHPLGALQVLSEAGEAGTRVGEFGRGLKKYTGQGGMLQAAFGSREVTLDFARAGTQGAIFNRIVAFFNAQVQGVDKMARQFRDRPVQTSFRVFAGITLPSLALAAMNAQDGRWEDLPRWQKDLFWMVPSGFVSHEDWAAMTPEEKAIFSEAHTVWKIPKPFEIGVLFGSIPERIMEWMVTHDKRAWDKALSSVWQALSPGFVPTAVLPLMENWANKSELTGQPVVPHSMEGLKPEYQYQPYTTETAKQLGKLIHYPPAKVENIVKGWTGGMGKHAMAIADAGLRKAGIVPTIERPTATAADMPVLKAFAVRYPSADTPAIQEFYDNYLEAAETLDTARFLVKGGQGGEAAKVLQEGLLVKLEEHHEALTQMRQLVTMVYENPLITAAEKRQLIDEFYFQMIDVAKNGNAVIERVQNLLDNGR